MQKKLFGILLALCMLCMLCVAVTAADGVYAEISDADGLLALMHAEDEVTLACNYKLTADIDMTDVKNQDPIGTRDVPFTGVFDGNGHKISGLDITSFSTEVGLFGGTLGATIENLTVAGAIIGNGNNVGAIVGRGVLPLTVKNCVNEASVLMMSSESKVGVAGIIGSVVGEEGAALLVENCVNYGEINSFSGGSGYCSGIVGYILSQKKANVDATITGCVNYGTINCMSASVAGGIMGYARFEGEGQSGSFTLTDSANFGSVTARSYNAGILGALGGDNGVIDMTFTLDNLYNQGIIAGVSNASSASGGVVGLIRLPILTDGVAPVYASNLMDAANAGLSVIGALGTLENSALTVSGLYNATGDSLLFSDVNTSGVAYIVSSMVTLSNCAVASSDANALAALVASDPDAWTMADGVPALSYFTAMIEEAGEVIVTTAPETTAAPETTEAPEVTEEAPETTVVPEVTEDAEETTKAPAAPTAPAEEGGAPIGVIIGIVAAVIVVAAVVVILLKKKKK